MTDWTSLNQSAANWTGIDTDLEGVFDPDIYDENIFDVGSGGQNWIGSAVGADVWTEVIE